MPMCFLLCTDIKAIARRVKMREYMEGSKASAVSADGRAGSWQPRGRRCCEYTVCDKEETASLSYTLILK